MMKLLKAVSFICISILLLSSCSKETLTGGLDEITNEQIPASKTLADYKVEVVDGALKFEDADDMSAVSFLLDTASYENRIAWEQSIGFQSMRSVYEKVNTALNNEEEIDQSQYKSLISFEKEVPMLINHTLSSASILSEEGFVMVGDFLGTYRKDGCFWSGNGSKQEVRKLIISQKHDPENGLHAYPNIDSPDTKTCTSGNPNDSYDDSSVISNGNNRGSSRLQGWVTYNYRTTPNYNGTYVDVEVFFKLRGVSERKGRKKWKRHRANHTFAWNYSTIDVVDGVTTTNNYSGLETHNNNEEAVKYILMRYDWIPVNLLPLNRHTLDVMRSFGTWQSTNYLSSRISYGCS